MEAKNQRTVGIAPLLGRVTYAFCEFRRQKPQTPREDVTTLVVTMITAGWSFRMSYGTRDVDAGTSEVKRQ